MATYLNYIILALVIGFFVRRWMVYRALRTKLPEYLKDGAIVVDVRSAGEYSMGHFGGSINIPLDDLASKAGQLDKTKTILLCCASGARSGMARAILKSKGFGNVLNIGSWSNLS